MTMCKEYKERLTDIFSGEENRDCNTWYTCFRTLHVVLDTLKICRLFKTLDFNTEVF